MFEATAAPRARPAAAPAPARAPAPAPAARPGCAARRSSSRSSTRSARASFARARAVPARAQSTLPLAFLRARPLPCASASSRGRDGSDSFGERGPRASRASVESCNSTRRAGSRCRGRAAREPRKPRRQQARRPSSRASRAAATARTGTGRGQTTRSRATAFPATRTRRVALAEKGSQGGRAVRRARSAGGYVALRRRNVSQLLAQLRDRAVQLSLEHTGACGDELVGDGVRDLRGAGGDRRLRARTIDDVRLVVRVAP